MSKILRIDKRFYVINKALYFSTKNILVISDLHLAYEYYLTYSGVLFPYKISKEILVEIEDIIKFIFKRFGVNEIKSIVLNGDIKHEFSKITISEWRYVNKLLNMLKKYSKDVIIIRGNHDNYIASVASRYNIEIKDYFVEEDLYIEHGHKDFYSRLEHRSKIKDIVIAHEHPAVVLRDKLGIRSEKYRAFIIMKGKGSLRKKRIILMPVFNELFEGTDFFSYEFLGLFMKKNFKHINKKSIEYIIYSKGELFYFPV